MPALSFRTSVTASAVWILVGAAWVVQLFVPWTSSGIFASSSLLDGVRLVNSGRADGVAPAWAAPALLGLPAIGLLLVALAAVTGRVAAVVRTSAAAAGVILVVLAAHTLADLDPRRLGPGGWTAVGGGVLALLAGVVDRGTLRPVPIPLPAQKVTP